MEREYQADRRFQWKRAGDADETLGLGLCGRLFAVFDRLQYLALGGVNAGVVERYYASASTTPGSWYLL